MEDAWTYRLMIAGGLPVRPGCWWLAGQDLQLGLLVLTILRLSKLAQHANQNAKIDRKES